MLGIFLDSETNGLNPRKHHVIEIAFKLIDVETGEKKDECASIISISETEWEKSDRESLKINGFTWEMVKGGMPREKVAERVRECFDKWAIRRGAAVFICQNPSFDRVFFSQLIDTDEQEMRKWPYHWLDLASMFWSLSIQKRGSGKFPWEIGCSKDKIATSLNLPKEMNPHRAMNGVDHLLLCYEAIVGFPKKG